jgi:hypothetical protein
MAEASEAEGTASDRRPRRPVCRSGFQGPSRAIDARAKGAGDGVGGAIELAGLVVAPANHREHSTVGLHRHQRALRRAETAPLHGQCIVEDLLRQTA